jgi:hypothetical protein
MNIEIVALNDRKYCVKRVIPERDVTDIMSAIIKQTRGYDLVLKKNGNYYYVDEIEDAEWYDPSLYHGCFALKEG